MDAEYTVGVEHQSPDCNEAGILKRRIPPAAEFHSLGLWKCKRLRVANDEAIYILDQITPKPGEAEAFLQHYLDGYVPLAKSRGLTLEHTWVNPPVWLEGDQSNTLFVVWSVKGTAAYYASAYVARLDPSSSRWWRDAEPMIKARSRSILSEASAIKSLTNV